MEASEASAGQSRGVKLSEHGTEQCLQCKAYFPTREELMQHKKDSYQAGKGHIHCEECGRDFHTERARLLHIHEFHAQVQAMECPGCGKGPFQRAASLIDHIEKGQCTRISSLNLDDAREKKLEFVKKLKAITKEPVKLDFTAYLPNTDDQPPAVLGREWDYEPEPGQSTFNDGDFPALLDQQPRRMLDAPPGSVTESPMTEEEIAAEWWNSREPALVNTVAVQGHAPEQQLQVVSAPSTGDPYNTHDIHHPDHAQFNVARYKNEYTNRYDCPRDYCVKTFKTTGQLIAHLRSLAHEAPKYQCPSCKHQFHTVTAIVSHAESTSAKCGLRNANEFSAFISQLTGGLIDVSRSGHTDGTLKFVVSKEAKELYGDKQKTTKRQEIGW